MPEKSTIARARQDAREGKATTTQAGEFVREEIHHIREGEHGARSVKQAIAIGLSKARRAGVDLPPPPSELASKNTQTKQHAKSVSAKRTSAAINALRKESKDSVSKAALSKQAKESASHHTAEQRSQSARKAAQTRKKNDMHELSH